VDALCGVRTTVYQRIVGILAPLLYAGVFLLIALRWRYLPEQIPTHFDMTGNVNGWGSRWTLAVLPAVGLVSDLSMAVALRFPRTWNTGVKITVFNRARVYRLVRDLIADLRLCFALLFSCMSLWLIFVPENLPGWILGAASAVMILFPLLRYFIRLRFVK
jgi:hypothetical protein